MSREPQVSLLTHKLQALAESGAIGVDPNYIVWHSAVYALLDCVYSAQANYNQIVLPMLHTRVASRPGLQDQPDLSLSAFVADLDSFGEDKFERYAREVLTRHVLARRRKVEICYEAALFFSRRGFERKKDFHALDEATIERLVLEDLQREIHGIGPALARYLLMLLGRENHIKPDVMIIRFFSTLSDWSPRYGHRGDAEVLRDVITAVAAKLGTSPARLDNAIWRYQRQRKGRSKSGTVGG